MTDRITSLHGAGGEVMDDLLKTHVFPRLARRSSGRIGLAAADDGATLDLPRDGEIVFTTDSHIVKPVFFPGGDIGRLAAAGTLNDLAVMGARPYALSVAAILEEGFPVSDLARILDSLASVVEELGVAVACGDTKVMPAGELDGVVLSTSGIGIARRAVSDADLRLGDRVLVTGTVGDHGMALLATRHEFHLETELASDVAPLWPLLAPVLELGDAVHAMKDPTRGGLAAALNEMARKSGTCIEIRERDIPILPAVGGLADLLGISPLDVANEGKAILVVDAHRVDEILQVLRRHPLGRAAVEIGSVTDEYRGRVVLATEVGGRRFLDMPLGDPVPRIC